MNFRMLRCLLFVALMCTVPMNAEKKCYEPLYGIMVISSFEQFYSSLFSIVSFFNQTYPNKNLILVNQSGEDFSFFDQIIEVTFDSAVPESAAIDSVVKGLEDNAIWTVWKAGEWRHPHLLMKSYEYMYAKHLKSVSYKFFTHYSLKNNKVFNDNGHHHLALEGVMRDKPLNDSGQFNNYEYPCIYVYTDTDALPTFSSHRKWDAFSQARYPYLSQVIEFYRRIMHRAFSSRSMGMNLFDAEIYNDLLLMQAF